MTTNPIPTDLDQLRQDIEQTLTNEDTSPAIRTAARRAARLLILAERAEADSRPNEARIHAAAADRILPPAE